MNGRVSDCADRHRQATRTYADATARRIQCERDLKAAQDAEERAAATTAETRGDLIKAAENDS